MRRYDIRPLTGQVLVEMLPADDRSGAIHLPDAARDLPYLGIVRAIGRWRQGNSGFYHLPEVKVGDRVVIGKRTGQQLTRNIGERFKLVSQEQVLAKIEETC